MSTLLHSKHLRVGLWVGLTLSATAAIALAAIVALVWFGAIASTPYSVVAILFVLALPALTVAFFALFA